MHEKFTEHVKHVIINDEEWIKVKDQNVRHSFTGIDTTLSAHMITFALYASNSSSTNIFAITKIKTDSMLTSWI